MENSCKVYAPSGLPEYYKHVYRENLIIIEKIFGNISEDETQDIDNCGALKITDSLLQFLDVITDVFNFSEKPCDTQLAGAGNESPILHRCLRRFREVFRHSFRGVKYLTPARFSETADRAEVEAIKLLYSFYEECGMAMATDEKEAKLGTTIAMERGWIEIVNENRRSTDLKVIMSESLDSFKDSVEAEFSYLYLSEDDLNYVYCEEEVMQKRVHEMIALARDNFRNQIPFEDNECVLQNLCGEFETQLKANITDDLIRRNSVQRQVIRDRMDITVEHAVELYAENMEKYLDKLVSFKRECLMEEHERVKNEVMPMFVNGGDRTPNEIGTHEYQVACWNRFNDKVFESFTTLMSQAIGTGKEKLTISEKRAIDDIEKCLEPITEILKELGLDNFVPDLHLNLETNLSKIFAYARDENTVTYNCLLQEIKPIRLLTEAERLLLSQTNSQDDKAIASFELERVDAETNTDLKNKLSVFGIPLRWIRRIWSSIKFYFCFGLVPTISTWRRQRCCA